MSNKLKYPRVDGIYEEKAWDSQSEKWLPTGRLIRDEWDNPHNMVSRIFVGFGKIGWNYSAGAFKIEWREIATTTLTIRRSPGRRSLAIS
jgi:hypothetical protein